MLFTHSLNALPRRDLPGLSVRFRERSVVGCGDGKHEFEHRAAFAVRRRSKLAAVLLNDHAGDGKSQPHDFVVTNASNTLSRFFGSIPGPESCTERTIPLSLFRCVLTHSGRSRSVVLSVASIALRTRLMITSCNCLLLPLTTGAVVVSSRRIVIAGATPLGGGAAQPQREATGSNPMVDILTSPLAKAVLAGIAAMVVKRVMGRSQTTSAAKRRG
jgi:hypothetical protein